MIWDDLWLCVLNLVWVEGGFWGFGCVVEGTRREFSLKGSQWDT